ncbi:MAG: DUF364 domain-containing protein [Firmicutes bacterium]|nr:DUF364 domain-containing protein [Bacillota bacterium]
MWKMYDELINGIPAGHIVEEVVVGSSWTMVKAGRLCGVAHTVKTDTRPRMLPEVVVGMDLKDVAAAAKSWNFIEAGIGMAAVNAYYNALDRLLSLGVELQPKKGRKVSVSAEINGTGEDRILEEDVLFGTEDRRNEDPFDDPPKYMAGKKVAVVGHFPRIVQQLSGLAELSILERSPSEGDYPDSACEFLIPEQDFLFITGMTLTNKTLPRLLQIAGDRVEVSVVGPSGTASDILFRYGVDNISGFTVTDPEYLRTALSLGDRAIFNGGLMYTYRKSL